MAKLSADNIEKVKFEAALGERYLAYALSTIMSRSLPDVRDGLKPVHRRLLYAMLQLKLEPKTGFKKCARIVGDVIGKYHPHGEVAVYDALVRMAQTFSSRYPMVDGQGNFGSIDGDSQAAMRYTEAKLTTYAMHLLENIDYDTVDFRPNYDGSDDEPAVLPASVPNILANGTEGIAVGMATSIPPHNLVELSDAILHLLRNSQSEVRDLLRLVKGPDFPTGGILVESFESMLKSYETGRGSFRLRAKWEKEELERGQYRIIITEIPYQVQKSALIENLAELFTLKKLPFLDTFQDLSAEDIRIVLYPKNRNINPQSIMETLFKLTDLEIKVQLNLNVLDAKSIPQVMNIKQVLTAFIEHRLDVTKRRLAHRLKNIENRLEILNGLLIAYLNLDEVIRIIREEDEPKPVMIAKWALTDVQVEAILNVRLRALRKLEEFEIRKEHDLIETEKKQIEKILASGKKQKEVIYKEMVAIKNYYQKSPLGVRKTTISDLPNIQEVNIESFVEREPVTVTCSEMGWLKVQKGHKLESIRYKEGDGAKFVLEVLSTDKILFFSDCGRFYTLAADKISRGRGDGDPIRLVLNLEEDENIINIYKFNNDDKYIVASKDGRGFVVEAKDAIAQTKAGKQILNCGPGNAIACELVKGQFVVSIGENRRLLVFKVQNVPVLKKGKGVALQKFKQGKLLYLKTIGSEEDFQNLTKGFGKSISMWLADRGGIGRLFLGKLWGDK